MNKDILFDISAGMYILSTKHSACFVDAVMQISSDSEPLICVSVMNDNYTNKIMKEEDYFIISVFGMESNPELIKIFGMNSSEYLDKFKDIDYDVINDIKIPKDMLGYLYLEKIDSIKNNTHTLFIGKVKSRDRFKNSKLMTYQYYQEHKEELLKVKTLNNKTAWICEVCGYIYYGEELPNDFICPKCKMPKSVFKKVEE